MSKFLESKKVRATLIILASFIILLLIFGIGIAIGYGRANFGSHFDQNYYRNFNAVAPTGSPAYGIGSPVPMSEHGIAGTVLDVTSSTISVKDQRNDEHSIDVESDTVIRENNNTIAIGDINVNDQIVVIGEPNDQGQVRARFIRVFTPSSTIPTNQGQ